MPDADEYLRAMIMGRARKGRWRGMVADGRKSVRSLTAGDPHGLDDNGLIVDITGEFIEGVINDVPGGGMMG